MPEKTREFDNRFFDSRIWNDFDYRPDDIVIASYPKSGTTLTQQIVARLVLDTDDGRALAEISPWLDSVYPDRTAKLALLAAQTHRRLIKTHLPADALRFSSQARYVFIARDGRDVALSLYDHQSALSTEAQARLDAEGRAEGRAEGKLRVMQAPTVSPAAYVETWLDSDGKPFWSFWETLRSWWRLRDHPQVHLLHFARLTADRPGQIRALAAFLDVPLTDDRLAAIVAQSQFSHMQADAASYVPQGTGLWKEGGRAFFSTGRSNRWREELPPDISHRYEAKAATELDADCRHWLATGER